MIAKREVLFYGWFGLSMVLHGTILLNRADGRDAMNKAGRKAKEMGASLFVFPEGTRNKKRDLNFLPFKKGAFHVALDNDMDILPIVVSQYDFFDQEHGRFDCGKVKIKILKPISVEGYAKSQLNDLVQHAQSTMYETFLELSHDGQLIRHK